MCDFANFSFKNTCLFAFSQFNQSNPIQSRVIYGRPFFLINFYHHQFDLSDSNKRRAGAIIRIENVPLDKSVDNDCCVIPAPQIDL